jgi:hypothetical protein
VEPRNPASAPEGALKPSAVVPDSNQSIPRDDLVAALDADLWFALAALDRVFGADQVAVVRIMARDHS